jgi:hypothetical protein
MYVLKPPSFPTNRSPKNAETIHFYFEGGLMSFKTGSKDSLRSTFFIKYNLYKYASLVRKDSTQAVCRRMRRLNRFLYLGAKNFEHFLKIQNQN